MYLQATSRVRRSPSPVQDDTSSESGCELMVMRTPSRKRTSHKCTPQKTPIRKPCVIAQSVNSQMRRFLQERAQLECMPPPCATVSVPSRDAIDTFIEDLETNIRSRVKGTYHDELFHDINTMVFNYKKKQLQPQQQQQVLNLHGPNLQYHIPQCQGGNTVHVISSTQPAAVQPEPQPQAPVLEQEAALDLEVQKQPIQQQLPQGIEDIPEELPQPPQGGQDVRQVEIESEKMESEKMESENMESENPDEDQQIKGDELNDSRNSLLTGVINHF